MKYNKIVQEIDMIKTDSPKCLEALIIEYKELSYRRDSARRRSFRSRSFKVTDYGTNQNPAWDFLLVNNTKWRPVAQHWSNYCFWQGVTLFNTFVLRNLCEYCPNLPSVIYYQKLDSSEYIFVADSVGLLSPTLTQ